jgi:DamX protein
METVVDEVAEEVVEESVPFSHTTSNTESIVETIPEPEPEKEPEVIAEAEPVKVPEVKTEPKPEPSVKDIKWLTKQDPKKYVLQLIGAYEQETIDVYLRAFKDTEHKIISFTASNKGKEWHVLVYGLYENRDQAVAAIEELPTKAKLMAPWPRTVQSIKDLLK